MAMTARPKLGNIEDSKIFKYEDPMYIFKRDIIDSRRSSSLLWKKDWSILEKEREGCRRSNPLRYLTGLLRN